MSPEGDLDTNFLPKFRTKKICQCVELFLNDGRQSRGIRSQKHQEHVDLPELSDGLANVARKLQVAALGVLQAGRVDDGDAGPGGVTQPPARPPLRPLGVTLESVCHAETLSRMFLCAIQ